MKLVHKVWKIIPQDPRAFSTMGVFTDLTNMGYIRKHPNSKSLHIRLVIIIDSSSDVWNGSIEDLSLVQVLIVDETIDDHES